MYGLMIEKIAFSNCSSIADMLVVCMWAQWVLLIPVELLPILGVEFLAILSDEVRFARVSN